jgi:sterol 14-demethylase
MTLLETLVSSQAWSTSALIILITTIGLAFLPIIRRPSFPSIAPLALEKDILPVIGGLGFFTRRANFLGAGRDASKSGQFSFHYGPHPIVALSGEAGRSTYYTTRGLDLAAGFRHLFAGGPDTSSVYDGDLTAYMSSNFKRFTARERLGAGLSTLTSDTIQTIEPLRQKAKAAGGDGTVVVDIFDTYFRLVYQLTQRTLGCNDIADDPKLLETTLDAYKRLDVGSATEIMFPWLPTPTKIRKMWAGYTLFSRISNIVKERRRTGKSDNDALQVMIDNGDHEVVISTVSCTTAPPCFCIDRYPPCLGELMLS